MDVSSVSREPSYRFCAANRCASLLQIGRQLGLRAPIAANHDADALLHVGDIIERIAVDQQQIGPASDRYGSELFFGVHEFRRAARAANKERQRRAERAHTV
jgi:hypothetical protein